MCRSGSTSCVERRTTPIPSSAPLAFLGAERAWVLLLVFGVWAYDTGAYGSTGSVVAGGAVLLASHHLEEVAALAETWEDRLLARLEELGVVVEDGRLRIAPRLLVRDELLAAPAPFPVIDALDRSRTIELPAGSLGFTVCQVPVVLREGDADRIVVRQDADGFQFATAYGNPVRFRQKGDPKGGKEGVWTDGEALRVEIDDRNERIELFERARVTRDQDVVNGEHIFLDQRTEFFSVSAAKGAAPTAPEGRVKAVIQPKSAPEAK